uniref:7TM_GPCR_Srx domain-containing protein n=1 Tax=Panagrellus redivivus TaxID=6233 RepID=A0A7E4W8S4_PANRE
MIHGGSITLAQVKQLKQNTVEKVGLTAEILGKLKSLIQTSYGLRRRLRELVTPAEAYAFQTAAPSYSGLQPIQQIRQVENARFITDENGKIQQFVFDEILQPINMDMSLLYHVSYGLALADISLNYKFSMFTDDFLLAPTELTFYDCILNTGFIKTFLSSLHSPIKVLDLDHLTTSKNAVKAICNSPAFKTLESFFINEPAFPSVTFWFEALVEANCTSLKEMFFHDVSLSALQIDKDLFFNFFKILVKNKEFRLNLSYKLITVATILDLPQSAAHFLSGVYCLLPHVIFLQTLVTVFGSAASGGFNAMIICQFALALNRLDVFKPKHRDMDYKNLTSLCSYFIKFNLFLSPAYAIGFTLCCFYFGHFTFDRETLSWSYDDNYLSAVICRNIDFWLTMSMNILTLITYFVVLYCMMIMKKMTAANNTQPMSGAEVRLLVAALLQFLLIVMTNTSWFISNLPLFIANFIWAWTGGIGTILNIALNQ